MRPENQKLNTSSFAQEFAMLNVVALDQNLGTNEVFNSRVVIRHATDPIFQVVSQDRVHGNVYEITLRGANGTIPAITVDLENTRFFLDAEKHNLKDRYIQLPVIQKNAQGEVVAGLVSGNKDNGYYLDKKVITGNVSVLPGNNWEARLARIADGYAQNPLNVKVEINKIAETFNGIKRIDAQSVKYLVGNDPYAETATKNEKFYYISDEDATLIEKYVSSTAAGNDNATRKAPYVFSARVIRSNQPGYEYQLDITGFIQSGNDLPDISADKAKLGDGVDVSKLKELNPTQLAAVQAKLSTGGRFFKVENSGKMDGMLVVTELMAANGAAKADKMPVSVAISAVGQPGI